MNIVFATVSPPAIRSLLLAERAIASETGAPIALSLYYTISDLSPEKREELTERIAQADLTFVDMMGSPPRICAAVEAGLKRTNGCVVPYGGFGREYLKLGEFTAESAAADRGKKPDMAKMKQMAAKAGGMPGAVEKLMPRRVRDKMNYGKLMGYFSLADPDNIRQMLLLMLSEYGGVSDLPAPKPPRSVPPVGICLPGTREYFDSWDDYCAAVPYDAGKPLSVLIYYGTTYPRDNSAVMQELAGQMRAVTNVLPVALNGVETVNDGRLQALLSSCPRIDAVVNTMSFRFSAGPMGGDSAPGVALLRSLDAPYLHPFTMTRRTLEEWSASPRGATASEIMISVMLPEMDGAVDVMPVGVRCDTQYDAAHDVTVDEMVLIPERAEMFVSRLGRLLSLRRKPNAEKKLAILCYNYPPGEGNLFGGAFLDTLQSVCAILRALREAGYVTEEISPAALKETFLAGRLVNGPRYSEPGAATVWKKRDYAAFLREEPCAAEMEQVWGKAPGEIMVSEEGDLLLPGVQLGNVWIGLQPDRGAGDDSAAYHDRTRPPHHQYLACYAWLRREFQADAVIHVGTHGTLEFLKGKEAAMSGECYPDRLIADMPHFYLYYCGNSAEAVIARRRSNAALISYMPPVFTESGLYDEYKELDEALEERERALSLYPAAVPELEARIYALGERLKLPESIPEMETTLYRMKHSLIPYGLHVFGEAYTPEEAADYASQAGAEDPETLIRAAAARNELPALLHALEGGYIEPGIGGDIYRTPEVLPSGRNLYQFDQRLVPSPTAMQRGGEIARQTLARFSEAGKRCPASAAVILWGLETSRTQGETIGQILSYWGVRCSRKAMGKKEYEIIPLAELGRPRIDVTINICGFFRDMFPTLIDELCDLSAQLSALPEPDDRNYIKAHTKQIYAAMIRDGFDEEEARTLSAARIFGPEAGSYGTGLTTVIEQKAWEDEAQLGNRFLTALRHVYTRDEHGRDVAGLYERNLASVEIVSQIRDNQEYELTDLDHYYEFFGGLSKSVELVRGEKAQMYVSDTTGREVQTNTAGEAIQNGLRRRILNPKWREGLLAHDYHGTQKIAERFENIMGLAATTGAVENWMFDELNAVYVDNEATRSALIENNRYAYMQMLEQMLEYYNRHYWSADEDTIGRIRALYRSLEDAVEEES